ncbi:MAG: Lrp/AsnC ligand binding domain-containing protein [Candidatus Lokiarchaeota archaeon]
MAEFFERENQKNEIRDKFYGLYEVYLLYFDEKQGHIPLLAYPEKERKKDSHEMRPIYVHSIWFLDPSELNEYDHIDLEYEDKRYFAKKFLVPSKREIKRRSGIRPQTPETIVLMLVLPTNLIVFGGELIEKIFSTLIHQFIEQISFLIISEIAKESQIRTPQIKEKIKKGEVIKERIKKELRSLCNNYFSTVIKPTETKSLREQLAEKGIDISRKIMAWLGLNVEPLQLKQVAKKLATYDNVIVSAITSGDHDIVVQLIADNEYKVYDFVNKKVRSINGIKSHIDISISFITGSKYFK